MPSIPPHDTIAPGFGDLLYFVPDFSVRDTWSANGYRFLHRLLGRRDKVQRLLVDITNRIRGVQIAMEAFSTINHECDLVLFETYRHSLKRSYQQTSLTAKYWPLTQCHVKIDDVSVH